jgi:hypothetical protein
MLAADKVWITELTLIYKNSRSVPNSHISQSDIKHIMTSPIITITSVLKLTTDIMASIAASPIGRDVILAIMSVSTFKTAFILYLLVLARKASLVI